MEPRKWDKYKVLLLIIIIISAFAIRLYYFNLYQGQALWYDEADYLVRAKSFFLDQLIDAPYLDRKPVIMTSIWSGILALGGTVITIKFFQVLISVLGVYAIYLLGKEVKSKELGLIMAAFLSVFWLHLFFSIRVLLDEPTLTTTIFAVLFFVKWIKSNKLKHALIAGALSSLAMMMFYVPLYLIVIYVLFLLLIKRQKLFMDKNFWYAIGIYILTFVPLMIWWYVNYGNPLFGFISYHGTSKIVEGYDHGFFGYLRVIPFALLTPMFVVFILGLGKSLLDIFSSFDLIIKRQVKSLDWDLFFFIWLLLFPLITSTQIVHVEPRYMFPAFVPVFYFMAKFLLFLKTLAEQYLKNPKVKPFLGVALIVVVLLLSYSQLTYADAAIEAKSVSFEAEQLAGLWLKDNMAEDEMFITCNQAVVFQYYSERFGYAFGKNETRADGYIEDYHPKFAILNAYNADCTFDYFLNETKFTPAQVYFMDPEQTQAVTVIYKVNY
ncbi:MAG: glycosyltransferase family 39 protein [Nanoarchaeota archaeon]|nr:glycosyltransferase family 39 protein [Nanoarchaeota archaeon]